MARQGYDLQLTCYDERGWRATFYTTGMEHSPTRLAIGKCQPTVHPLRGEGVMTQAAKGGHAVKVQRQTQWSPATGPMITVPRRPPLVPLAPCHPLMLAHQRVLRVMLHTGWSTEAWSVVRVEFRQALAPRAALSDHRRSGG